MKKNAREFVAAIMADPKRKAQIEAFPAVENEAEQKRLTEEKLIPLAAEMGYTLTIEDFTGMDTGEVDDRELAAVSGGRNPDVICKCALAGGGGGTDDSDGNTVGCACAAYGQGGDGRAEDANCFCVGFGEGTSYDQYF